MLRSSYKRFLFNSLIRLNPYIRQGVAASLLLGSALSVGTVQAADLFKDHSGAIRPNTSAQALPNFVNLVKQVKPAVVSITARINVDASQQMMGNGFPGDDFPFPFFMAPQQMPKQVIEARGSGFIISPEGYIVTNNHVVQNAKKITVTFDSGATLDAKVIGRDAKTDLALLKVQAAKPFPFVQLGDSDGVEPGEWVIAVGDPYGLGGTVTAGIVSARGRNIGDGPYDSFIQVDAPINRGNSGGPLISQDGKVIGVNTAILSPSGGSIGIGFAIPSSTVKNIIGQLEKNGHVTRGFLGVVAQTITPSMTKALKLQKPENGMPPTGALVASVSADSPAEKGGIKIGDVILTLNGKKIESPQDLAIKIAGIVPNTMAKIGVVRDGVSKDIAVKIVNLSEDQGGKEDASRKHSNLGIALAPLSSDFRRQLGVDDKVQGVVITGINSGSPADQAGLQTGDIIVAVGNLLVNNPKDTTAAIHQALKGNNTVLLRVLRDGQGVFVPVTVGNDND